MDPVRYLLLPGWQGSDAAHWQSLWAHAPGFTTVDQADWWWPRRGDWMAQLEQAVLADDRPTVLVAHSLGCHLVARWAGHSANSTRVRAALLVAPPELHRPALAPQLQAWAPALTQPLPFASTVVASDDDPWCSASHARQLAQGWASQWRPLHGAGHCNASSGLGAWPSGQQILARLCQRAGVPTPTAFSTGQFLPPSGAPSGR